MRNSGRVLVATLILGGLAGSLITGAMFYSRMMILGGLLLGLAWAWMAVTVNSLRLTRTAELPRASAGDIFKERYDVMNAGTLPALWVEVSNETSMPAASGSRLLTMIHAHEKQSFVARTWLTQRGAYPLGPTVLTTSDPLGLFRLQKTIPPARSLVVLPMIFPILSFLSPPGLLPGGKVIRKKSGEVTPHAAGVREYVTGDPLKRIHWPTSARRGQLMVKEFELDPQAEVWILLDAQQSVQASRPVDVQAGPLRDLLFQRKPKITLPPSTLEYSISIAASLAHFFIQERRAVGFVTEDRAYTLLAAERSERQENKILETLAFISGRGKLSIAALTSAQARRLPQGSSVILITPTIWPELLAAADDLQRRNLRPMVILLVAESFGGKKGSDKLMGQLIEQRVPVCPMYCNADVSQTLSTFSSNNPFQDVTAWQRPTLSHLT